MASMTNKPQGPSFMATAGKATIVGAVGGIAGPYARKRSVECQIYGVRYVGWYYETAGDYCRLRRAKSLA